MFGRRAASDCRLPWWPAVLWAVSNLALLGDALRNPAPATPRISGLLTNASLIILIITLAVAAFGRTGDKTQRRLWRLPFLGFSLVLLSNVFFGVVLIQQEHGAPPSMPLTVAGLVAAVASVVLLMLGLFAFPMRPMNRGESGRFWLDMLTVVGSGLMVLWYVLIGPALQRSEGTYELLSVIPPIAKGTLLFAICALLMRAKVRSLRHPLSLLSLGMTTQVLADLAMTSMVMTSGAPEPHLWLPVMVCTGNYLVVMAAAVQIRTARTANPGDAPSLSIPKPTWLPYAALAVGYGLLVVAAAKYPLYPWAGLVAGAVIMTAAVAVRQMLAMQDNRQIAVQDTLTGLASRMHFHDALTTAVHRRRTGQTAVLAIDLDGFKQINDTLGHAAGDALLVRFGEILRRSLRSTDTAGRLGGDEFAVILPDAMNERTAADVARRILAECEHPVTVAGEQIRIRASIGIAVTPTGEPVTATDLLQRADAAMYVAKRRGSHSYAIFGYDAAETTAPPPAPTHEIPLTSNERAELENLRALVAGWPVPHEPSHSN